MAPTPDSFRAPLCRVDLLTDAHTTRVLVSGEIDLSSADAVQERIRSALETSETGQLVVDLRGLTFMDSTGLRLLVWLTDVAREYRHLLSIVRPPPPASRTIEIAGLDAVLPLIDDPTDLSIAES